MRQYSFLDSCLSRLSKRLPIKKAEDSAPDSTQNSISLMRVNHSGEVAAQALYMGQAWVARDHDLKRHLKKAAKEESLHLEWCENRIHELGGNTSRFNPLWWAGSFCIGTIAGLAGDKISLGFLAETEFQVTRHLNHHLTLLPKDDLKSREIVSKMRDDELTHANEALRRGGVKLPWIVRTMMKATAKVMTTTAAIY